MGTPSVNDIASLINNQIAFHERIQDSLLKTEALAYIALSRDFLESSQSIVTEYMSALHDLVIESKMLHQYALNNLIRLSRRGGFVE
ncbi:MAG TPA: hypothetical protein VLJ15_08010 [Gammaproteobacteria bacterium]|nr:hypothetical protein [Gammaproteobacteria bacterium]